MIFKRKWLRRQRYNKPLVKKGFCRPLVIVALNAVEPNKFNFKTDVPSTDLTTKQEEHDAQNE